MRRSLTGIDSKAAVARAVRTGLDHPAMSARGCAIDAISGFDWLPETLTYFVPGLARNVEVGRYLYGGLPFPEWNTHDDLVWLLARAIDLSTDFDTRCEVAVRIDGGTKRADLVVCRDLMEDDRPLWVVEVKSRIAGNHQARQAVNQVLRYCCGFALLGPGPRPVVVAGETTEATPSRLNGVAIVTPVELLRALRPASLETSAA